MTRIQQQITSRLDQFEKTMLSLVDRLAGGTARAEVSANQVACLDRLEKGIARVELQADHTRTVVDLIYTAVEQTVQERIDRLRDGLTNFQRTVSELLRPLWEGGGRER
jgi:uncharacterized protein YicC (UPF0701 family)